MSHSRRASLEFYRRSARRAAAGDVLPKVLSVFVRPAAFGEMFCHVPLNAEGLPFVPVLTSRKTGYGGSTAFLA
jgi:hypothetical protein